MFAGSYVMGLQHFTAVVVSQISRNSIEKGLCEDSILGFAAYGLNIGPNLDYFTGYEFCRLAVNIGEQR